MDSYEANVFAFPNLLVAASNRFELAKFYFSWGLMFAYAGAMGLGMWE